MRICIKCKKPMYASNESIWIKGQNYNIHKKCKDKLSEKEKTKKGAEEK